MELVYDYNATRPSQAAERGRLLPLMFASVGSGCWIEPPLHANWGGRNVHLGNDVYANFNLTLVDDGPIYIGDKVMFGPNVVVTTAGHPVAPELRLHAAQFNLPVTIGNNVWIGSSVQIMPGVTIGDNTVIGAGSVVTRNLPENAIAVGTPCRVVRTIGEHDRTYYWRDRAFDLTVEELLEAFT
ncbi:sugar O-acetyltransferase [Microlunatus ginsengisoli]|uniref:Acetyltransferase n=1 Tax=Microlunatus ginsengisoli TaxID=363863 RepID=A0ABP6ZBG7_9ACTN